MKRLAATFARTKQEKRAALVTYIMAGDPDLAGSAAMLKALPAAGADIIELGFPFSDPMADGPTIQAAAGRALNNGMTLAKTIQLVADFRRNNSDTPVVLMGYANPVLHLGIQKTVEIAAKAGADGLLIVDVPPEEGADWAKACAANGLAWIRLAAPTTDAARARVILARASGFLYYVSLTGITGSKTADAAAAAAAIAELKKQTDLPIAVGFGIKTPEQAKAIAGSADAVVVGSAVVDLMQKGQEKALAFVQELARAMKG